MVLQAILQLLCSPCSACELMYLVYLRSAERTKMHCKTDVTLLCTNCADDIKNEDQETGVPRNKVQIQVRTVP